MKTENPLPALDAQLNLLRFWQSPDGASAASFVRDNQLSTRGYAALAPQIQRMQVQTLLNADPYFVASPICSLIAFGAESIPDLPIGDIGIPGVAGFVYFSIPLELNYATRYKQLRAFSWHLTPLIRIGEDRWAKYDYPKKDELNDLLNSGLLNSLDITFYTEPFPTIPLCLDWPFEWGWRKGWGQSSFTAPMEKARFVYTYFAFLAQPLVMRSVAPIQRQARKRAATAGLEAPLLHIVQLRRPVRQERGTSGAQPRVWNWQWIVKGHWRNQWYPSLQSHKLKWIESYLKGPEDKPLKRPSITIFNVVR